MQSKHVAKIQLSLFGRLCDDNESKFLKKFDALQNELIEKKVMIAKLETLNQILSIKE